MTTDSTNPEPDDADTDAAVIDLSQVRSRGRNGADKVVFRLDDESDDEEPGRPVDLPEVPAARWSGHAAELAQQAGPRRPIVAPWLRTKDERRQVAKFVAGNVGYRTGYHAARAPIYLLRTTARAPIGAAKLAGMATRWVLDTEGLPLRLDAVRRADADTYMRLLEQRRDRVRWRILALAGALVTAGLVAALLSTFAPVWAQWSAAAVVVAALALIGSTRDKPLVSAAVVATPHRVLSADVVVRSLVSIGISKTGEDITFPQPIQRDGPGYRAVVDLPYGVPVHTVVGKRIELAAGLDLSAGQVWPEGIGQGGSARRLVLWVGDQDLSSATPVRWPLIKAGTVDLFAAFPFGTDQRGTTVPFTLMFSSLLTGALPRMGKTFAARLVTAAAALDPTAVLHTFDFKGGSDWMPFEPVSHTFGVGDDAEVMDLALATVRRLLEEMSSRYKTIRRLPPDLCPESKVTRRLANSPRYGLQPIVLTMDECHVLFIDDDRGEEAAKAVTELVKRGPAVGIMLNLATQKPDQKSIPSGIRDQIGTRFGMRVMTWQISDMILGTGMSKAGYSAATLTRGDKGIGYLVGASDEVEAQLARTYLADTKDIQTVVARARAERELIGNVTGHAAGETTERDSRPSYSIVEDVWAVFPSDEEKLWAEVIVERLRDLRPDAYETWKAADLTRALKPHGIRAEQVWKAVEGSRGTNRNGYSRDAILAALPDPKRRAIDPPDET